MQTPTDFVHFKYMSAVVQVSLNSGHLKPLPWEDLMLEIGWIDGLRKTAAAPAAVLAPIVNVRDACMKLVTNDPPTFLDWRKTVKQHEKVLLLLEPAFAMDIDYLLNHAEAYANEVFHAKVLACMPTETFQRTLRQVLCCIAKPQNGRAYL